MYIVNPICLEKVWGDHRLIPYGAKSTSTGIVYSVSGTDEFDCEIENHHEKTTLQEAIRKNSHMFGLEENEEYPVIIAFDSCKESVSFQIHPTDAYAQEKLHLLYGKSEAWYFIEAPSDGWVYANAKEIDMDNMEQSIEHLPVKQNDLVYIRSGTVHALTKGSLIYEIQQSTNITYRFYDYGRDRPLHIKESFDNLDLSLRAHKESFSNGEFYQREFDLEHRSLEHTFTNHHRVACAISIVTGTIEIEGYTRKRGQSLLVLPNETIKISGKADVMVAYPHTYWRKTKN